MKVYPVYLLFLFFGFTVAKNSYVLVVNQGMTAQQKAGKNIYTKGIGTTNVKITAEMSGVKVSATIMPCINCHKADGTGNPEGGIVPSNITWAELTKNYGGKRQDNKKRPAYDKTTLRKVITTGIDSGENQLHTTMPKYNMSREDLDNLIEYIKIIGTDKDVEYSDSSIQIGVVLPEKNTISGGKNEAIKNLVNAYCSFINNQGGIYNRKIEPSFLENKENFTHDEFFMLMGFGDKSIAKKANLIEIPALLSFSKERVNSGFKNQYAFYVYPSLTAQSVSLIDFYKQQKYQKTTSNTTIVYSKDQIRTGMAKEVADYYHKQFGLHPNMLLISQNTIEEIAKNKSISSDGLLIFIGPNVLGNELLNAFYKIKKTPFVLIPGSVSGVNLFKIPATFQNKVFIGYPTWVSERTYEGIQTYQNLNDNYKLNSSWKQGQLDMLSMLLTTEECLKRIGKNLSRPNFKETMEGLFEYSNGLTPSITYNLNKRVGNSNIYIIGFDTEKKKMKLITTINSKEK
ncbi:cytochrome c/ABC transporter substrate-binding protein [Aquimarina sediminis]|uniref:cytochrome c/ABC transporter substrate-binding protein n=1 Tax=Aquimarina sediminis TaxID=2070536 RepID=UPI000CA0433E|nr:c-type cytochrome [Aquimarina sediminis]